MRETYSAIFAVSSRTGHGCSAVGWAALSGTVRVVDSWAATMGSTYDGAVTATPTPDAPAAPRARPTARRVLLAAPRGYCAGVDRAVVTVEKALEHYGAPVYVRKQIVHNVHVVSELEKQGAIFVDDVDEAPPGAHIVF